VSLNSDRSDPPPHSKLRFVPVIASLAVFALAGVALHRLHSQIRVADVLAEFAAIDRGRILASVAFTALSYLSLSTYEQLALRFAGRRLSWADSTLTSFVAYAIGHNVGVLYMSGAAVRYRMYAPLGLRAMDIARVVAFCALTFALGGGTLAGLSLIVDAGEAASLVHSSTRLSVSLGAVMLALVLIYVVATVLRRAPLRWRGRSFELPRPATALAQIALSGADLIFAGAALYALLPHTAQIPFSTFAGLYIIALTVGALSAVPGGLGVFETVLVLLVPGVPATELLGALLGYRLIYYGLPLACAVLLLARHEIRERRRQGLRGPAP
jgi:uncharacterized membrane protein YbhN (UPF0104 family)